MSAHAIERMARYTRGHAIPSGRMTYGYRVACACGWERRVNDTKRAAVETWRWHVMDATGTKPPKPDGV